MRPLCIVLTSDYDKSKDTEKEHWKKEAEVDFSTVKETLGDTHDVIEIKVDVFSKDAKVEELIPKKLLDTVLENTSSCHIVINSHGSVAKKDLQDSAIKKVIERLSSFHIPIYQMTALTCHAMSENSVAYRNAILNAKGINTEHKNNNSLRPDTTMGILIKKLNKMELPMVQKFNIVGPSYAYDAENNKDWVKAMLNGETIEGIIKKETVSTRPLDFSIKNYKSSIQEAIDWITDNQNFDKNNKALQKKYDKYTNLLGNLLSQLFDKLEEKYKHGNEVLVEIQDETSCLQDSLINHLRNGGSGEELNAKNLKKVYKDWKEKHKVSSEKRLTMFQNYIELDDELLSPMGSRVNSPLQSNLKSLSLSTNITPVSLENRFFKHIDNEDNKKSPEDDIVHSKKT